MHVPGQYYSNYIILAGNLACDGLTCFCAFYTLAPPKTPYYTPVKPNALHVTEIISRGFRQLEECSRFATVMFLDRKHFCLFD